MAEMSAEPDLAAWIRGQQQRQMDGLRDSILWLRKPVEQRLRRALLTLACNSHRVDNQGPLPNA